MKFLLDVAALSVSFLMSSDTSQSGSFVTIVSFFDELPKDCWSNIVPPCSLKHSLSAHIAFGFFWYDISSPILQVDPHILHLPSYFAFITVPMTSIN